MFNYYFGWILFSLIVFVLGYVAGKMVSNPEEWFD